MCGSTHQLTWTSAHMKTHTTQIHTNPTVTHISYRHMDTFIYHKTNMYVLEPYTDLHFYHTNSYTHTSQEHRLTSHTEKIKKKIPLFCLMVYRFSK